MYYCKEGVAPSPATDIDSTAAHIYEFSVQKEDYFYNLRMSWENITSPAYELRFGNSVIVVPSGLYVVLCDESGVIDWVLVDEVIGRDMSIMLLSPNMKSWSIQTPVLVEYHEEYEYYLPKTENALPITNQNNDGVIVVSRADQYSLTKDKLVDIFVT